MYDRDDREIIGLGWFIFVVGLVLLAALAEIMSTK